MIKGSIVALITPFDCDNNINYLELERLLDFQLENKTDGVLLLGTTAEAEMLSLEEKIELVSYACNYIKGRMKIIVGIISNVTNEVIKLASYFDNLEIDAYLVICPYYIKSNKSGMLKHFTRIADSVKHPVILYNVPKRTGMNLDIEIVKILSYHTNIIGIKEASGDLNYQSKIASFCSDDFLLYAGDDNTILASLALGAKGVISVINNAFPKEIKIIVDSFNKDINIARSTFFIMLPIIDTIYFEVSPIGIKYLLYLLGFKTNKYRLPLDEPSKEFKRKIEENIFRYLDEN